MGGARGRLGLAGWALVGVCIALIGLDLLRSWQERAVAMVAAHRQATDLAYSLAEQARGTLLGADEVLLGLRERIEAEGTAPAMLSRLQRIGAERSAGLGQGVIEGFYALDATGRWLIGPAGAAKSDFGVGDRPFFALHRDHPGRALQIGTQVRRRASGRWVFTLSRRIDRADGGFAGVIVAPVDIERMQAAYGGLELGPHGIVTLLLQDGRPLLRQPFVPDALDAPPCDFGAHIPVAPQGSFEGCSPVGGGMQRVVAFRRLPDFPAMILVGLARGDLLAEWRRSAVTHLLGTVILSGLVASLGILLLHAGQRHHAAQLAAAAANSEYRLLADHATDLILRVREGGRRTYASPACRGLLGYSPEEMLQRTYRDDVHRRICGA